MAPAFSYASSPVAATPGSYKQYPGLLPRGAPHFAGPQYTFPKYDNEGQAGDHGQSSPIQELVHDSYPDFVASLGNAKGKQPAVDDAAGPVQPVAQSATLEVKPVVANGITLTTRSGPAEADFSTDGNFGWTSRYVEFRLKEKWSNRKADFEDFIKSTPIKFADKIHWVHAEDKEIIYLAFDSLRQAQLVVSPDTVFTQRALGFLGDGNHLKLVPFVNQTPDQRASANEFEGQLILQITSSIFTPTMDEAYAACLAFLDDKLGKSDLRAFVHLGQAGNRSGIGHQFRVEIDSLRIAEHLLTPSGDGCAIEDTPYTATVVLYQPLGYQQHCFDNVVARGLRSNDNAHNAINFGRIMHGQDVRTTVMLRNIPNQMDTYDLEALLQEWVPGRFDFMYLRIDFANMCNVGYAFVNFSSPMDIIDFKNQLHEHGWPMSTHSRKIAAMSYATVQGTEALIEKFRNSSVMCESVMCRPRLFISIIDAYNRANRQDDPSWLGKIGHERVFPGPNNDAKLQRSRQNAETQGLWPAHSRDDQRRGAQTHQFDRGNPNAYTTRPVLGQASSSLLHRGVNGFARGPYPFQF